MLAEMLQVLRRADTRSAPTNNDSLSTNLIGELENWQINDSLITYYANWPISQLARKEVK